MVIEKDGIFYSVQCRTSSIKAKLKNGELSDNRFCISLRTIKTNTKQTVIKKRGKYDLLFVLCSNDECYSIPSKELPLSGTTIGGPKYEKYKIGK